MRVIQINLNHCEAAQDLLYQEIVELKADVAIISEPFQIPANGMWLADREKWSAIYACGNYPIQEIPLDTESGVIAAKINGIYFYSCYAPPRLNIQEFNMLLDKIADNARGRHPTIIAGDFNAWASEWGSKSTNTRGTMLLETFARVDVSLANHGNTATFRKNGRESVIDITFASSALQRHINWRVSERFTFSDHQALIYEVVQVNKPRDKPRSLLCPGWSTKWFDKELFRDILQESYIPIGPVNEMARWTSRLLHKACDASLPKKRSLEGKNKVFWWNESIKRLRTDCLKARRRSHRAGRGPNSEELRLEFKRRRKSLRDEIRRSKRNTFRQLCLEADNSPWGSAYKVVMTKIKAKKMPQEMCPMMLRKIVQTLFPSHAPRQHLLSLAIDSRDITEVTIEEITDATKKVGSSKAPGPDGIPNIATKEALVCRPDLFASIMQSCLEEGRFPSVWKKQMLILLPKPGKPPGEPSSYRPICLLDTLGKILERIIQNRLLPITEGQGGLSNQQFGFRRARSTVDAVNTVVTFIKQSGLNLGVRARNQMLCAVIALDIKNAFNSANWGHILSSLQKIGAPLYIVRILDDYFRNRLLLYESDEGTKTYNVSSGVPQGSVLGPMLWNVMYNEVFELKLPDGVQIVGFADDIEILVKARHLDEIEMLANEAIAIVRAWLQSRGLELAEHKTEAVLISRSKKKETATFEVGVHRIESADAIKYLGVILDDRLSFVRHVGYAQKRASKAQAAIARMMPNVGGPKSETRLLISSVVRSILLYASPVWAGTLHAKGTRQSLNTAYRQVALRVISGYRTISSEAAYVIAGMCPVDLIAADAKRRYDERTLNTVTLNEASLLERWQLRWDNTDKGRWTHRLIPNVERWRNRKYGLVNFQLTQFLSGHGGFAKYLHRFQIKDSAECPACPDIEETPEHVIFECKRFDQIRADMAMLSGDRFTPDGLVDVMLQSNEAWDLIANSVTHIVDETRRMWTTADIA